MTSHLRHLCFFFCNTMGALFKLQGNSSGAMCKVTPSCAKNLNYDCEHLFACIMLIGWNWQFSEQCCHLGREHSVHPYLRCSMMVISLRSTQSGWRPFMHGLPFLASWFLSLVKLTDGTLFPSGASCPGPSPSSDDGLRLMEAALWNLSKISILRRRRVSLNSADTLAVHSAAWARNSPT